MGLGVAVFAQNEKQNNDSTSTGWKSHTQCENNETPKANSNGAFTATWKTESKSSTKNESGQHHLEGGGSGKGSVGVLKGGGDLRYNYDGGKKTDNTENSSSTSHSVKYDCVSIDTNNTPNPNTNKKGSENRKQ